MYQWLKMLLLLLHSLRYTKAASKVTKEVIKATSKVVTKVITKVTKAVIGGPTKAREKTTRVVVNSMKMVLRVMLGKQLQIGVKIPLANWNLP